MNIYFKKIINYICFTLLFSGAGKSFGESHEVSFDVSQVEEISLINSLTKKALDGDGEAAYEVGRMYLLGKEVPKMSNALSGGSSEGKRLGI